MGSDVSEAEEFNINEGIREGRPVIVQPRFRKTPALYLQLSIVLQNINSELD